ncbi:hypothetical protein E4U57_001070 [Claviceps arundinis]|uniref:DUF803 domain membrane protein n=1 Tax=Claviceps arundinis TaxID=1623583 RepID=A0A9P7MTG5_9HYPO|nr:hypothetical protein E4U57_001070 [Claviceps arundinis]KAG5967578.1 hypothetical protein E4U56_000740 [Claviceps arundinis]
MEALSMIEPRNGGLAPTGNRPDSYKAIGISLAVASGLFIGTSFVLKKVGLLRANEKYKEVAGEGYGYLKNAFWWGGMTLMIFGEILNFVAYAFTDAILVTPLGALSVVITAVLSAIFLKERLSMVGKVACFLCIIGSVIIALNGPRESSVANIEDMRAKFITPGFLSYAGVIIVGSVITAWYVGPRWGKKNMLVYISICSWIGGLSVVSTQGLGAAIIAWIRGEPEYKHWFLWVLFVFVICTLLTEIIFLNKALNLFNAALVTPTYYVYFTSTTIITSTVLFQGFKGTPPEIATVVLGFLTICSGVVLLQLSKSAKDVPDAALFKGDLDQIQTIGEQEQPESEPKADAIRGTAAIMRRISKTRVKMEAEELKRLHEEKMADDMAPIGEDGLPEYEWDGLRRRKTLAAGIRERAATSPPLPTPSVRAVVTPTNAHPPLGMSRFPTEDDEPQEAETDRRPFFASITGTVRARPRTSNTLPVYGEEYPVDRPRTSYKPVPLTRIGFPQLQQREEAGTDDGRAHGLNSHDTGYHGAGANASAIRSAIDDEVPPPPPPHTTRRQFSFHRVFRRNLSPSEEERVGLVKEEDDPKEQPGSSFV